MKKVRKQFVKYAMLAIFVLLTTLLVIINGIGFTGVSEDADQLTQKIADAKGLFKKADNNKQKEISGKMGPMGPNAPDMHDSIRYFTVVFDDGEAEIAEFHISAVSESNAIEWARTLKKEKTGWTKSTYRYRVYKIDGKKYVTVIDQGRELLGVYRILKVSVIGEIIVLIFSFILLELVGKKLFLPLEEADRKQRKFIANIESEFKIPLTVINANTEIVEKENGSSEYTKSINRQVKKMTKLVRNLGSFLIFDENDMMVSRVHISNLFSYILDYRKDQFEGKNLKLVTKIQPDVVISGDEEAVRKMINELIDNSLKFAVSRAEFSLEKKNDRVVIRQMNDAKLPNGNVDQIFDRFTTLENADDDEGAGLGLSHVKDIVKAHNGRILAKVTDGNFLLEILL